MAIEFRYLCEEKIVLSRTCVAAEDMGIGNMEGRGFFFFACMHGLAWELIYRQDQQIPITCCIPWDGWG
jgi:hypothetical protein